MKELGPNFFMFVLTFMMITDTCHAQENDSDFWNNADIQSCFAKIRTVASVNPEIRKPIDRVAITARLDLLYDTFIEFIDGICTENETIACENFFDTYNSAFEIANETYNSLSNSEKKEINGWAEDEDYESERKFFLALYNNLSVSDQQQLRQAFTDILNLFSGSSLKRYVNDFLRGLNYDDQQKLKEYGETDNECAIKSMVSEKLKDEDVPDDESEDLEKFLLWAFYGKVNK